MTLFFPTSFALVHSSFRRLVVEGMCIPETVPWTWLFLTRMLTIQALREDTYWKNFQESLISISNHPDYCTLFFCHFPFALFTILVEVKWCGICLVWLKEFPHWKCRPGWAQKWTHIPFCPWHPEKLGKSAKNKSLGTWLCTFQSPYFWEGPLKCYRGYCEHCYILYRLPLAPALPPCLNVCLHFPSVGEGKHEYIYGWSKLNVKMRDETSCFMTIFTSLSLTNISSSFLVWEFTFQFSIKCMLIVCVCEKERGREEVNEILRIQADH